MDAKKIAEKVTAKLNKTSAALEFDTKKVELENFHALLNERLLGELKKEWKLNTIDTKELDWDWKNIDVEWEVTFPRSSGVLNISISAPDQKIVVSGKVRYTDEKDEDYEHMFVESFEIKNIEVDLNETKIGDDISPNKLEVDNKKFILHF